jgi:hypothetical protein
LHAPVQVREGVALLRRQRSVRGHQREADARQTDTGDDGDGREAEDERAHDGVPI